MRSDFDVLNALLEDRVSFGEIIASSVGYHDVGQLNAPMTALLEFKFLEALRTVEDRPDVEFHKIPKRGR
jgi:hypothetical protein